jgi:uncharacterized membrane protein
MLRHIQAFARCSRGNVAVTTAICLPIVLAAMALGVDYGSLTLQQQELQTAADLAAITAAATPTNLENGVLAYASLNGRNIAVLKNGQLLNKGATVAYDPATVFSKFDAYAVVSGGTYQASTAVAVADRFKSGATPYDAVRVTLYSKGGLYFANNLASAPTLNASGTAAVDKVASFSIGSRLASLNGGVVNSLLGKLLGTTVSLSVMDYQSLANANVDLLKVFDKLAIKLNLTAATYDDLLNTSISYGTLLNAIGQTTGVTPAVSAILKTLETNVAKTKLTVKLKDLVDVGPLASRLIGQSDGLTLDAGIFDLVSTTANIAHGSSQVDLDLGATIPGLANLTVSLAVGEPPVGATSLAVGKTGTIVRTAQTRLAINATVDGLTGLLGIKVKLPLYLEVAHAEANLASITCGPTGATVGIEAVPGVLELSLGDVDTAAFANFGKDPRVTKAKIVQAPLINLTALAYANATNMNTSRVSFSPSDISSKVVKNISTQNTVSTLTSSLLKDLTVEADVLGIKVALPTAILGGLVDTLNFVTAPLDQLLYSLLGTLGVKIGQADIRVGGASCKNPVLVQ